jgi:hypothetical protein
LAPIELKRNASPDVRDDMRLAAHVGAYDVATLVLLIGLITTVAFTFHDYAISNDEAVQHHYGELIIAYYESGFTNLSVFNFQNLYLYGGLFDIVAVLLSHLSTLDPFEIRHALCALIGVAGIGATAATARLIAGPRAGLIAAIALSICGSWYGGMFNHTKDIPLAAAMTGATFFLLRAARDLPRPRLRDTAAFGLLTGAALGIKVLGLLLVAYLVVAIAIRIPRPVLRDPAASIRFAVASIGAFVPALLIAYALMIAAWPWAGLAPLNPIRGLVTFADFHYAIPTMLAGTIYEMATVPRWYVPTYLLIKLPLPTLLGAALAIVLAAFPRLERVPFKWNRNSLDFSLRDRIFCGEPVSTSPENALTRKMTNAICRRETAFVAFTAAFPLACQVIAHGPAFTGLRHFLFVIPLLSILAGIAFDVLLTGTAAWHRELAVAGTAVIAVSFLWPAIVLARLHPYEYLYYNPLVGGLKGASRRYVMDYWVNIMPAAVSDLEGFLKSADHSSGARVGRSYTVAVCGERLPFEDRPHPNLQWTADWPKADFFIAPTHMNCDRALAGRVIATIERLGVPIGVVKDRRLVTHPGIAQNNTTTPSKTLR